MDGGIGLVLLFSRSTATSTCLVEVAWSGKTKIVLLRVGPSTASLFAMSLVRLPTKVLVLE